VTGKGARSRRADVDGILLVDKPRGISSAAAVAKVKRSLAASKVGHLGTLDPFASGLLPLCLGEATKIAPYLNEADKSYVGVARLGVRTDTLDVTGQVESTAPVPSLANVDWSTLAAAFTGAQQQVPPAFSAIKRDGVRMYELARRGEAPELEPRSVVIHRLALARADDTAIRIDVDCSKGTYIRSLARDLGERLGCGATLESLVRTRFGPFVLEEALALSDLEDPSKAAGALLGPAQAVAHLRTLLTDAATATRVRAGQQAALLSLARPSRTGERARILGPDGGLVAVVGSDERGWRIERVFRPASPCAA
jgi:tRNA pseudouridine55 synthase